MSASNYIYDYLEAGFRIFPLWEITPQGACGCGDPECAAIGKHPRIQNWQQVPHWSDEQIETMDEMGQFDTGFGVCVDDHLVIDIDKRNGGFESYERLCKDTGIDYAALSNFVVETGGGGLHIYFKNEPPISLLSHLNDYKGIDFKVSGYVCGCGSIHKSGDTYEKQKGNPCDLTQIPEPLLKLLKKPDHYRVAMNGESLDITDQEIADMLKHCDPDCAYDDWIKVGMAIHHATSGAGMATWNAWSSAGEKYSGPSGIDQHWQSFGKAMNPVTIGSLIHFAEKGGYRRSVTFDLPATVAAENNDTDHPFSIDTVDLLRPPGFVGKITKWINSQCRFPREYLAVAGAMQTIGNICGLRYTDDKDGITTNMFTFGIAASATGKEAIQTAMIDLHRAAGITAAVHGNIKSEQEITRNLIRHQCAFYIVDEVGILLSKISNSAKSGASYLEGVIGLLMSAYGKANGYLLISGDLKEDIRSELHKQLSHAKGKVADNEDPEGKFQERADKLVEQLDTLDDGLINPMLSLIGFTTPVTFDKLITYEQATNGFVGRSLLVREHETNPKEKDEFKKAKLDPYMAATLKQLYHPGFCSDERPDRLEHNGERIEISTTDEAWQMLKQVKKWIYEYAEHHKGTSGFEAVVRRGYELCAKVSLILACPERVRTAEHVRWAYAMIRRDIDSKVELARRNQLEASERQDALSDVLVSRIKDACANEAGEAISTIMQRASNKRYTKEDVSQMVQKLVEVGDLQTLEVSHPKRGITTRYTSFRI